MKLKRLITIMLGLTLLLTAFVVGAYAVDENTVADWAPVKSQFSDDGQLLTGDALLEIGDHEYDEIEPNNTIVNAHNTGHDRTLYGSISDYDVDIFSINLFQTSTIMFFAASDRDGLKMELLDNKGNILMSTNYSDYDELYYDGIGVTCGVGTYYVRLTDSYSYYYYNPLYYLLYFSIEEMHDYGYGQCGDNAYWECSIDGVLNIYGHGDLYNFKTHSTPWYYNSGYINKVIIEEGITSIPEYAFEGCKNLKDISIPKSVDTIYHYAFKDCNMLSEICIPGDNVIIKSVVFSGGVKTITVSGDNVVFEQHAAFLANNLETLNIEGRNTIIGDSAFIAREYLKTLNVTGNISEIGSSAFLCCNLSTLNLPDGIDSIGDNAFTSNKELQSISIDGDIAYIGKNAFTNCIAVEQFIVSGDVGVIGDSAFESCSKLVEVNTEGISIIGSNAFLNCDSLSNIDFRTSVSEINNGAFMNCVSLTCISFDYGVQTIGANAFADCCALKNIRLEFDAPAIDTTAFTGVTATVYYPADNVTYTEDMMLDYGGDLTWVAHTHNYGEGTIITEAFDTTEGEILYQCADCGYEYTEIVPAPNPFDDVILGEFYYDPVMWALNNDITKGVSDNSFAPGASCTRGQVVTFLWRAVGCPEPASAEHNFTDVVEGDYYYKAMLWAVEQGITLGTSETTFSPHAACNRGQVVTFLWRAAGSPAANIQEHNFTDVDETQFYFNGMLWAVENGITNGISNTEFAPNNTCNRGQVVTFLYRQYA